MLTRFLPLVLSLALLASCGGGGGNTAGGGNPPVSGTVPVPVANAPLAFDPATLTLTIVTGVSRDLFVRASIKRPEVFAGASNVYALVVDNKGVVQPRVELYAQADGSYTAVLHSSSQLAAGTYEGQLSVQLCKDQACSQQFDGSPMPLPYKIEVLPDTPPAALGQRKLLASQAGVALTSTPTWSRLSYQLSVRENTGAKVNWHARSDQAWLTVTASGDNLVLRANPTTLPSAAISYATVTLVSDEAGVTAPEPVKVALWKSDSAPSASVRVEQNYRQIAADPIRPLVYVNNADAGIDVYNLYTQAKVARIELPGAQLGTMAVSPDGAKLFALDLAAKAVLTVDLATRARIATWAASGVDAGTDILAMRPNGQQVVLLGDGSAFDVASGKLLGTANLLEQIYIGPLSLAATTDGRRLFVQNRGSSPSAMSSFYVVYDDVRGFRIIFLRAIGAGDRLSGVGQDLAVALDGSRVYTTAGPTYKCSSLAPSSLADIGVLPGGAFYPRNVEVGSDGRVYCANEYHVWVHAADETLLKTIDVYADSGEARLRIGSDGMNAALLSGLFDTFRLILLPVGP
jgi:hypothetical protein